MSFEETGRLAWRSPSPLGQGGAPASQSSCSQPASSLQYLNALEEAWSEEQELSTASHFIQLSSDGLGLQRADGHLVLLIDSFNKDEPTSLSQLRSTCAHLREHVWDRAYKNELAEQEGAQQQDPGKACSTTACRQQKQKPLQEGQLRTADLSSEQKLEQRGEENSFGIGAQESPPKRPWRILVDTGAELSVAPRSFAENTQLSPCEKDPQLRTANGIAIQTFGMRTVQLLCQGFSFSMTFVIADVEQPLLGLSSLLRHNLSLHLDSNLGHHLGNKAGDKIRLEQRGQQIYLVACPAELGLNPCMIGNLLDKSLSPKAKNLGHEVSLDKEVLEKGGANSFSFGHNQHKPTKNKTAIGQQTALPRAKPPKQKGHQKAVSKLRTQRFTEKIQLALLDPAEPRSILDEQASKDLSLRILLTLSLMKKWQLTTTRVRTALPQQQTKSQLRELGLGQSVVDSQIFVGIQLCVMLHEHVMLIGGEKKQQEDFLNKLSACIPLEDTSQLDDKTPLNFMGRSLEYNRAERSISLHLSSAFYLQLLRRYSLEDATSRDSPRDELENEAPRWTNIILDAEKTKLYRQTVGDLQWSSLSRPDISFAVQQLSNSFMKPTESHEHQLVNLLRYLKGTQHYRISLQPPRRWMKAKSLELLAFS